jgi:hypothetical protein
MEELPPSLSFDHRITLDANCVPEVAKVYPLSPKEHKACRSFVDEHLTTGKSNHPNPPKHHWSSLFLKRMGQYVPARTTVMSIPIQLKTRTSSPSSPTLLIVFD